MFDPDPKALDLTRVESDVAFLGFALSDCTVELDPQSARYLRPVNRTALELATYNRFGSEIGGFWLMHDQIAKLRNLPEHYPSKEAPFVASAVEAYLRAQLHEFYSLGRER
ncbi:MAG: hypothetical protein H0T77_08690 [Pyrinomonadaceae bacterium]|jgi:hypothetical protein|nr:hypothetical protein [Pyrinomonadaceae bacterium]